MSAIHFLGDMEMGGKERMIALCADYPKPVFVSTGEWTTRWNEVTCKDCLARKPLDDEDQSFLGTVFKGLPFGYPELYADEMEES